MDWEGRGAPVGWKSESAGLLEADEVEGERASSRLPLRSRGKRERV